MVRTERLEVHVPIDLDDEFFGFLRKDLQLDVNIDCLPKFQLSNTHGL